MFNHFLTAKYRIVTNYHNIDGRDPYYAVYYKPKYSFYWGLCRSTGNRCYFDNYQDALKLALNNENGRGNPSYEEYTADELTAKYKIVIPTTDI